MVKNSFIGLINLEDSSSTNNIGLDFLSDKPSLFADRIVLANGDLNGVINNLGRQPGVISSRWLTTLSILGHQDGISAGAYLAFTDASFGKEEELENSFKNFPFLLKTRGIFDYVIGHQDKEILLNSLNNSSVRNFQLVQTNFPVSFEKNIFSSNLEGKNYTSSLNKYERDYSNNPGLNANFFSQCEKIAEEISHISDLEKTLIYAPLRGAKPITDATVEFLRRNGSFIPKIVYSVTSSFVFYPASNHIFSKNGGFPASARYSNIRELRRLRDYLGEFKNIIYLDEIVSGGMMTGHCFEIAGNPRKHKYPDHYQNLNDEGILRDLIDNKKIKVYVYGLADYNGKKFRGENKRRIESLVSQGLISFKSFPTQRLVTEDQRFVLGQHYLDYQYGPNSVPFILDGNYPSQKNEFERELSN